MALGIELEQAEDKSIPEPEGCRLSMAAVVFAAAVVSSESSVRANRHHPGLPASMASIDDTFKQTLSERCRVGRRR